MSIIIHNIVINIYDKVSYYYYYYIFKIFE